MLPMKVKIRRDILHKLSLALTTPLVQSNELALSRKT